MLAPLAADSRYSLRWLNLAAGGVSDSVLGELLQSRDARSIVAAFRRVVVASASGAVAAIGEAKLVVLGEEAVGKTSLVNALVHGLPADPQQAKTAGVNHDIWLTPWIVSGGDSPVRLNIWDFGGQQIQQQTHRFFLTERCIHLLVITSREEDAKTLSSWLRTIEARSPNSPIIVVINKCDNGTHNLDIDLQRLRRDHPDIVDPIHTVSCAENPDLGATSRVHPTVEELRATIARLIASDDRLTSIHEPAPAAWLRIRDTVRTMAEREPILDAQTFTTICANDPTGDLHVTDGDEQRAVLRLLDRIGTVVAHGLTNTSTSLTGATLLNPNWLTDAIYALLSDGAVRDNGAVFDQHLLASILHRTPNGATKYPSDRLDYVIDMMQHPDFLLAYRLDDHGGSPRYLLPQALTPTAPEDLINGWDPTALRFRFRYTDLPVGLIPQFQVAAHQHTGTKPTRWRSGCTLTIEGCPVLIDGHLPYKYVDIAVAGPKHQRRDALAVVRDLFRVIHDRMPETEPEARVPLPQQPGDDVPYKHLQLLQQKMGDDHRFIPQGATDEYTVSELLNGIRPDTTHQSGPAAPVVVNIDTSSHSSNLNVVDSPGAATGTSNTTSNTAGPAASSEPLPVPADRAPRLADLAGIGLVAGGGIGLLFATLYLFGRHKGWPLGEFLAWGAGGTLIGGLVGLALGFRRRRPR